jgi:protein-S-isoprenylcysteine O-methyltransferase Ste14
MGEVSKRKVHVGDLFGVILLVCIAVDLVASLWVKSDIFRIVLLRADKTVTGVSISIGTVLLVTGSIMGYVSHEVFKQAVAESGEVKGIIKDGLFKLVRHPFYLSLILITLSLVLLFDSYVLLVGSAVVAVILVSEARKEERLLAEEFGEEYFSYQRETGMFFPKIVGR